VKALPARGSLGVLGKSGFTDLYAWIKAKLQSDALASFPGIRAFQLITKHKLLGEWTTSNRFEFRHRDFIQEIGKDRYCLEGERKKLGATRTLLPTPSAQRPLISASLSLKGP